MIKNYLIIIMRLIQWTVLSGNKNAMELINEELKKEKNKICWEHLSSNINELLIPIFDKITSIAFQQCIKLMNAVR